MLPRLTAANRFIASQLLDEMPMITGLHPKSLIRLLNAETLERQPRERPRGKTYNHAIADAVLDENLVRVCSVAFQ